MHHGGHCTPSSVVSLFALSHATSTHQISQRRRWRSPVSRSREPEGGRRATGDRSGFVPRRSGRCPGDAGPRSYGRRGAEPGAPTGKPEADGTVPCDGVRGRGRRRGHVSEGEPIAISPARLRDVAVAEVAVTPGGARLLTLSPSGSTMTSMCLS